MALNFKSDNAGGDVPLQKANKGRVVTLCVLLVLSILFLAWFDGGEEQLHPITQTIDVPQVKS